MDEREFIRQFTSEYSQLLNSLIIARKYNDPLDAQKNLIVSTYTKNLKPLTEDYLSIRFPEIEISTKTRLDMDQTLEGLFGWLHFMLKDTDLKRATRRLLYTLIKAV